MRPAIAFVTLAAALAAACSPDAPGPAAVVRAPLLAVVGDSGTYFVATDGSDDNPGIEEAPWRTIGHALPQLRPGQILYLRGGTYVENIKNPAIVAGRADARITVAGYPGERPVIVGLLWLTRPNYWTITRVNVTWSDANLSTEHMVKITNGVGWIYRSSELWGARSYAALLVSGTAAGEPADWTVRGNCIHDTYPSNNSNRDHNLYVNTGTAAGAGMVAYNVIYNAPNGQNVKLGYGASVAQPDDGTANVTVRYNTMYGALKNVLVADGSHSNVIERNIIAAGEDGYAIRAYRLTGANNVFRDNVFSGFERLQYADPGYASLTDGGGNLFPLDPEFDGASCDAFRPLNAAAQPYGRHAR